MKTPEAGEAVAITAMLELLFRNRNEASAEALALEAKMREIYPADKKRGGSSYHDVDSALFDRAMKARDQAESDLLDFTHRLTMRH